MWSAAQKARADDAVARIHSQTGEVISVRRFSASSPDMVYQEDLSRQELEYTLRGIVDERPDPRKLKRYGISKPVSLQLTFSWKLLGDAAIPGREIVEGDIIVWQGIRHAVIKTQYVSRATIEPVSPATDPTAEWLELEVFTVVTVNPNTTATSTVLPATTPSILSAAGTGNTIAVTLSVACVDVGTIAKRVRVRKNDVVVALDTLNVTGTMLDIVLVEPVVITDVVTVSYVPQLELPVTHGITDVSGTELLAADNIPVTLS